jgi:outer membrane protein assembly factor BamD (BamD/ComL family)
MQVFKNHLIHSAIAALFIGTMACQALDSAYVLEEQGRGTWREMFDKKMDSSAKQWGYAHATQKKGWLKKADRRMLYLVRRWPNSTEAPWAARARGDMLFTRGKLEDAFDAYQYLIDNYSSRMDEYDSVLEVQFDIACRIMDRRRMKWMLGGYRAPEYAVEYFETIIRNGPQWSGAAEAQYMIGQCHEEGGEHELAIAAYGLVGYRYPDSRFAEDAAWQQILCLGRMHDEYPNSPEMLDRLLTATTVFLSTFPASEHKSQIVQKRNELYEVKAGSLFNQAAFYAEVPKKPQAAILYDKALIEEYPKSSLVPESQVRIRELEELLARPVEDKAPVVPRAKPLPFG